MKKNLLVILLVLTSCGGKKEFIDSELDPSVWGFEHSENLRLDVDGTRGGSTMSEDEINYYFTITLRDSSTIIYKMSKDTSEVEILNDDPTSFCSPTSLSKCTSFGEAYKNTNVDYPVFYNNKFYFSRAILDSKTNEIIFGIHDMNTDTTKQRKIAVMSTGTENIPMFSLHRGYLLYPNLNDLMIHNVENNSEKALHVFDEAVSILRIEPVGDLIYLSLSGYKKSPESVIAMTMQGDIKDEYLGSSFFRVSEDGMILFEEKDGAPAIIFDDFLGNRKEITTYPNALIFKSDDYWVIDQIFGEDETDVIVLDNQGNFVSSRKRDKYDFYGLGIDDDYFYTSWRNDDIYQIRRYNLFDHQFEVLIEMVR